MLVDAFESRISKLLSTAGSSFVQRGMGMFVKESELDAIGDELFQAVNETRFLYENGIGSQEEYRQALRKHNDFAINRPIVGPAEW
jgi:hypothetical protein